MSAADKRCAAEPGAHRTVSRTICASTGNTRMCAITGHWPKPKTRHRLYYNWRAVCALCGAQIVKVEPSGSWRTVDRVRWVDPRLSL
jgi:hypothetical protein